MANVEHEALAYGEQHVFHFAEYANSTAREAATGLVTGDDHKVALQTDDHSLWILTAYGGPTWLRVSGVPSGTKMWFYQNTAPTGWTLDATPADELLAVKGGSQAYNAAGGTVAGTWTVAGLTKDAHAHAFTQPNGPNHNHQWYDSLAVSQHDKVYNSTGTLVTLDSIYGMKDSAIRGVNTSHTSPFPIIDLYTAKVVGACTGGAVGAQDDAVISSDATWRPKARLGIICTKD